jgi:hypothetical protein
MAMTGSLPGQSTGPAPAITSVRVEATNLLVTASVPEGLRRVTLESRDRLGGGGWEPRVVARLDGSGGSVTFRLPRTRPAELMRVRAEATEPLPASFYAGTNEFYEIASGTGSPIANGGVGFDNVNAPPENAPREVVESDIWKIRGKTLYFFNQLRGLQVVDLSNPDAPQLRGTLDLPAVGEDMYTLGEDHVVLLARTSCAYNESEIILAVDRSGQPEVTARLKISGYLQESRLVGNALYVVSSTYRPATAAGAVWEHGTLVSSFDLADPSAPIARDTLWYTGSGHVIAATDILLFVVTQDLNNWWQSTLRAIDITSPDGRMAAYQDIPTAGRVPDKFKIRWRDGVLTTVSEDWRATGDRRVTTRIETFRLPDPRSAGPVGVAKLGELEVGRGEQLHASRFDGDRLYIVTFFRIDPLWVIDLANPASPRVAGSVDVPGWSTYIRPLGDRLVTIGVETGRVAVSLFNVADPSAPVLTERVRLGENYSSSEANWDEQAFSVLPDAGLILVPFSGDTTNGYASSVQLIDFDANSLTPRGVIQHELQPRRATLYEDRILSLSGWELLSVDASDRDHPVVRSTLALAWPVDRVFLEGDYLLEIGGSSQGWWGWGGWGTERPTVRVTASDTPNVILQEVELAPVPVLGASVRAGKLYVAQGRSSWGFGPIFVEDGDGDTPEELKSKLLLSVYDLGGLPAVQKLGQTEAILNGYGMNGDVQAVWPKPGVLVLAGGSFNWFWSCLSCPIPMAMDAMFWPGPWRGGGGGRLVAFDVTDATSPVFASEVELGTNGWWSFSSAFASEGFVYLSHQTSSYVEEPVVIDPAGELVVPTPVKSRWVTQSFLDVVDYTEPRDPLVRRPVNIPGRLNGISHGGALLYTVGTRWASEVTSWTEHLAVSSYDGVEARLVDSIALPNSWPHPVLVENARVYVGWPDYGTNSPATAAHSLQVWQVSNEGKLARSDKVPLTSPAGTLAEFRGLLVVQLSDQSLSLFDASGDLLRAVGSGRPAGCQWYDLKHADGALDRGVWLPLGAYGVMPVPVDP